MMIHQFFTINLYYNILKVFTAWANLCFSAECPIICLIKEAHYFSKQIVSFLRIWEDKFIVMATYPAVLLRSVDVK